VLAAAATEAFINEMAEMIGLHRQNAAHWNPDAMTPPPDATSEAAIGARVYSKRDS
jgi:hypothetical protein